MELKVEGQRGADAEVVINVKDIRSSMIFRRDGDDSDDADIITIKPSTIFQKIGVFPIKTTLFLFFHKRPWSFDIQQKGGSVFSHSSADENLTNATITTPDIVSLSLNYAIPKP